MEGSGVVTRERRNNMVPPPLVLTALRAVRTTVSAHRTCIVCLSASRGLATPKPASGGPANQGGLRPPNTQRGPPRPPGQPGNAGSRPNAPRPPPQKPQSGPRTPQQGAATRAAPAPPKPAASKRQPKTEDDGSELEAGQKNEEIDPNLVIMLIGTEGERLANMTAAEAMTLRESKADPELGLPDLLIVAARAKPPVARLVWPEPEKKPAAPQPKQVQKKVATVVKELEIYTSIARHDLMVIPFVPVVW
ncbi:hypothetical protein DFJ74DRAFT_652096 [Hyaloraphidium curvatum]|nr:hypothetical protein DFJ74DRAFT_652096 [Hyaloraphidium curvatum]